MGWTRSIPGSPFYFWICMTLPVHVNKAPFLSNYLVYRKSCIVIWFFNTTSQMACMYRQNLVHYCMWDSALVVEGCCKTVRCLSFYCSEYQFTVTVCALFFSSKLHLNFFHILTELTVSFSDIFLRSAPSEFYIITLSWRCLCSPCFYSADWKTPDHLDILFSYRSTAN